MKKSAKCQKTCAFVKGADTPLLLIIVRRGANTLRSCGVLCVNFAKSHQRFCLVHCGRQVGRKISETSKGATEHL